MVFGENLGASLPKKVMYGLFESRLADLTITKLCVCVCRIPHGSLTYTPFLLYS